MTEKKKEVVLIRNEDVTSILGSDYFICESEPFMGCLFFKPPSSNHPILCGKIRDFNSRENIFLTPENITHLAITKEKLFDIYPVDSSNPIFSEYNVEICKEYIHGCIFPFSHFFVQDTPQGVMLKRMIDDFQSIKTSQTKSLSELKIVYTSELGTIYEKPDKYGSVYIDGFRVATSHEFLYSYNLNRKFLTGEMSYPSSMDTPEDKCDVVTLNYKKFCKVDCKLKLKLKLYEKYTRDVYISNTLLLTCHKNNLQLESSCYKNHMIVLLEEGGVNSQDIRNNLLKHDRFNFRHGSRSEFNSMSLMGYCIDIGIGNPNWMSQENFSKYTYNESRCRFIPYDGDQQGKICCASKSELFPSIFRCERHRQCTNGYNYEFPKK
jgi:hypothetical protein